MSEEARQQKITRFNY